MSTELIINASLPETRIALMENGEIQELLIERASGKGIVGNIYKGRVTRVLPGMQAAFVDIGLEKAAFLYVDDVFVHSEVWEAEEARAEEGDVSEPISPEEAAAVATTASEPAPAEAAPPVESANAAAPVEGDLDDEDDEDLEDDEDDVEFGDEGDDEDEDEDDEPVSMGAGPGDGEGGEGSGGGNREQPAGTVAPPSESFTSISHEGQQPTDGQQGQDQGRDAGRKHRRGRRGGRNRRRDREDEKRPVGAPQPITAQGGAVAPKGSRPDEEPSPTGEMPEQYYEQVSDQSLEGAERPSIEGDAPMPVPGSRADQGRAEQQQSKSKRDEFNQPRDRGRRIKSKEKSKPVRGQANIQDLLKEGQEVIVQVAKDPIATKGARLTCHISLPGRHLVCMPTIDHVGVSRRIERDEERRRLREFVEKHRPRNLGFIVRTASGKQSEKRVQQDIQYLTHLWSEIREKAATVTAPALVYEDLNSVLRAIRDWVTEDIDKIVVDSRYHYNDIQRFASHFMPSLQQKVELYHGDVPIFDAYGITTELSRALERKVWLKSGGYLVIDQAEALVAIDVNTGRYVGKKNLEDTILKTNLEAVQEIAYQLRLRNCGGIIILDLIDMEKEENKQRVYRALEEALKKDRSRPSILKISELGLVEMTRKRTRDTIVRAMCNPCAHCEGKGFIKSPTTVGYEIMREIERLGIDRDVTKILVQANVDVIDYLAIEERDSLDQLERRYRKQIYLQTVADNHPEQFEIISEKQEGATKSTSSKRSDAGKERGDDRERGGRDRGRRGGRDRDRGGRDRGDRDRGRDRGDRDRSGNQPISAANMAQSMNEPVPPSADGAPQGGGGPDDDDRLAFQRAQAAQDAAVATGGQPGQPGQQNRGPRPGQGQGQGGQDREGGRRGRRRRGRRGGRGNRDNRPQNGAGPIQAGPQGGAPSGGGGGGGGESGGGAGGGGESGGGGGGGGDHTPPPTT